MGRVSNRSLVDRLEARFKQLAGHEAQARSRHSIEVNKALEEQDNRLDAQDERIIILEERLGKLEAAMARFPLRLFLPK